MDANHHRVISYLLAQTNIPPTDQFTTIWPESGVDLTAVLSGFVETQLNPRRFFNNKLPGRLHILEKQMSSSTGIYWIMMIFTQHKQPSLLTLKTAGW